jgi:hypothetical protein
VLTALTLDRDGDVDSQTDFDAIVLMDALGTVITPGEYKFANTLDLGGVFSLDLARRFAVRGYYPNDLADSRSALVDSWSDFDGSNPDAANAKLYMRSTKDDPSNSSTYTDDDFPEDENPWREFVSGTFVGRAFQFKAELSTSDEAQNIAIDQLGYEATFQRRQENSDGVIFSTTNGEEGGTAGTYAITFNKPFFVGTASLGGANAYLPSIGVTVQDLGNGERVNVSNVTSTGFSVDVLNSSGTNVTRKFSYTAVGYGRRK